jgi:hypothetical protein
VIQTKEVVASNKSTKLWRPLAWLLTIVLLTNVIIPIGKSLVEEEFFSTSMMVIKTYHIQLPENQMYFELHAPKHEKLHPREIFHFVNTHNLHINQWFNPQVQILHKCIISSLWVEPINNQIPIHGNHETFGFFFPIVKFRRCSLPSLTTYVYVRRILIHWLCQKCCKI